MVVSLRYVPILCTMGQKEVLSLHSPIFLDSTGFRSKGEVGDNNINALGMTLSYQPSLPQHHR